MKITNQIQVDLETPGSRPTIFAVQNDSNSRSLEIDLRCSDKPFLLPENVRVLIRYRKPDGTGGEYDTLPDGSSAWQAYRNYLTLTLVPRMFAAPGTVNITVSLIEGDQQLSIFPVLLHVDPLAASMEAEPENYFYVTGFLPAPGQASQGQYLRVAEVNDSGRVTAMEAVDGVPGSGGAVDEAAVQEIVADYLEENPPASGKDGQDGRDGEDGKSAYEYAKAGGYPGTEEEFSAKLAEDTSQFIVTITSVSGGGYTTVESGAEILDAYKAGRTIICKSYSDWCLLNRCVDLGSESVFYFSSTITHNDICCVYKIVINHTSEEVESVTHYIKYVRTTDGALDKIVEITDGEGEPNEDGSFPVVSSMTYQQIASVLADGIYAYYNGVFLQMFGFNSDEVVFSANVASEEAGGIVGSVEVHILSDGTAYMRMIMLMIPTTLPSPYPLTINGTSYDGSAEVDLTDTVSGMIDAKAVDVPSTLPNPKKLIFTGAASGEYDGSEEVTIEIPAGGDGETETVLSDNLLDLSLLTAGQVFYYGGSNYQLVASADTYYGFIPLRGAGTYRTKFQASVHSSTAKRIALVNDNNEFVANVTGSHGDIPSDDTRNWLDFEFVVTQAHIAAGATRVAFDAWVYYLDQTMLVKDRDYPDEYIPYGYIEVATDSGQKQTNILCGRTAIFLGDSICAGTTVGTDSEYYAYGWGGIIGEANRMNWTNYGKNGGTITHRGSDSTCIASIADTAIGAHPGADYVILEGGCNDADQMKEAGLGVISADYATFDTTTFSGALESLILKLVTAYPYARIGYIIPQKMYTGYSDYTAEHHIHRKYFDRAAEICRKWGIPVLDLWHGSPLNPKLPTAGIYYVEENGQHLTEAGYLRITPAIEAFMRNL